MPHPNIVNCSFQTKLNSYSTLLVCLFFFVSGFSFAQNNAPKQDLKRQIFKVLVNSQSTEVTAFNDINYATFLQKGTVDIIITSSEPIKSFVISPLKKGIRGTVKNANTLQFKSEEASYLVVTINGKKRVFLFGEGTTYQPITKNLVNVNQYKVDARGINLNTQAIQKAINETAARKQTLVFSAGIYKTGKLELPSNTKIYLEQGAILKASDNIEDLKNDAAYKTKAFIRVQDAENVEVRGLGIIDGNGTKLRTQHGDEARFRILLIVNSKNVNISGVIHRDPGSWNTQTLDSDNITFKHVKLINNADLANTDGFDPDASTKVSIENCFAYCGDDNVAIKITLANGLKNEVADITVKGCVFLTRKSSLKVGTESRGSIFKNIVFEDNDVVMSDRGMALYCSDGATYENIQYLNNRFEANYQDAKQAGIHFIIDKRNSKSKAGAMKNILIKDCTFHQAFPKKSVVKGFDADHTIDIKISNLVIGNKKVENIQDATLEEQFSKITFEK